MRPNNNNESENKKYMITLSTDPYHGRLVCEGRGRVLERCGATPVKVVIEDDFGRGLTLDEAKKTMRDMLNSDDGLFHFDDDDAREMMAEIAEDLRGQREEEEVGEFPDWYEGAGWYDCNNNLVCLEGETRFTDDIRRYAIEEFIPEPVEEDEEEEEE